MEASFAMSPVSPARALREELAVLRPSSGELSLPEVPDGAAAVFRAAHAHRLSALCLSGGGIRSAAFSAGLLEGLARRGRLGTFDFLSTVSGGGYAGAWISAWRLRAAMDGAGAPPPPEPWPEGRSANGESSEPEPLRRLRRFRRYLAPHEGAFSIDLWSVIATMGRNLILNWLALLPLLAGLLLLPYLYLALIQVLDRELVTTAGFRLAAPSTWILGGSGALIAFAAIQIARGLPGIGGRAGPQHRFLALCLTPLCLGILGLILFWAVDEVPIRALPAIAAATTLSVAVWVVAGLPTRRRWRPRTWWAAAVSGAVAGAGLWMLTTGAFGDEQALARGYATFAFPLVLGLVLMTTVLFVGLSREETTDEDLEWWSRFGAWILVVALAWLGLSVIVFWGPMAMDWMARELVGMRNASSARVSALTGLLTTAVGAFVTLAGRSSNPDAGKTGRLSRLAVAGGIPIFAALLLTFLALLNLKVLRVLGTGILTLDLEVASLLAQVHLAEALALAVALTAFGAGMAAGLPVNRFSLNGMYRNRLVRSFVGASRPQAARSPSPFTGFDSGDDVPMAALAPLGRPLHIVNATLNAVADRGLAEQDRRAESFTFSPLHCGSWKLGYRPSHAYAGGDGRGPGEERGVSLGTAATVSGAAASPNMGRRSTPALTFLLTLFNARLGAWFGNPGSAGESTWGDAEPRLGPFLLFRELLGATTERSPYVFLSDGGHFENLGLYEMVRRRCHFIVVSDASCDPEYLLGDLSEAIRMIRVDFSIAIDFPEGLSFRGHDDATSGMHYAIGRIRYSGADGPEAPDGILIYAKATLTGDEPCDVVNYARSSPSFPHEPTSHQFFSEAQFESYRMLGCHTVDALFERGGPLADEGFPGRGDPAPLESVPGRAASAPAPVAEAVR
ncbi:MAG: hypothetical protein EA350_02315 [Gemmatimonadales bacterium]|nr:MAG: hypothetical protein EA350_02315 [Gemmatimonadales bacterium]